jgi:hypothetical protein
MFRHACIALLANQVAGSSLFNWKDIVVPSENLPSRPAIRGANPLLVDRQATTVQSTSTAAPAKPTGWIAQGCYVDSVQARSLSYGANVASNTMTNAKCRDACFSAGYILAGTEYAGECFCDNALRNGGGPTPDGNAGCNVACNGNQTEMCGGSNRLTLFRYYTGQEIPSSSSVSHRQAASHLRRAVYH